MKSKIDTGNVPRAASCCL